MSVKLNIDGCSAAVAIDLDPSLRLTRCAQTGYHHGTEEPGMLES